MSGNDFLKEIIDELIGNEQLPLSMNLVWEFNDDFDFHPEDPSRLNTKWRASDIGQMGIAPYCVDTYPEGVLVLGAYCPHVGLDGPQDLSRPVAWCFFKSPG